MLSGLRKRAWISAKRHISFRLFLPYQPSRLVLALATSFPACPCCAEDAGAGAAVRCVHLLPLRVSHSSPEASL